MDHKSTTTTNKAPDQHPHPKFYHSKHVHYIQTLTSKIDQPTSYEGALTEHLRMSGIYWTLSAISILCPSFDVLNSIMNVHHHHHHHSCHPNSKHTTTTSLSSSSSCILDFVFACYDSKSGGFGGNIHQDGHILYTLSALQILAMCYPTTTTTTNDDDDELSEQEYNPLLHDERLDKLKIIQFIQKLQQDDGSFVGDNLSFSFDSNNNDDDDSTFYHQFDNNNNGDDDTNHDNNHCCGFQNSGEIDTRFTYCAISSLSILLASIHHKDNTIPKDKEIPYKTLNDVIDTNKATEYLLKCQNHFDGGFGCIPGAESHAGQIFCCVASLSILKSLDRLLLPQKPFCCLNDDDDDDDDSDGVSMTTASITNTTTKPTLSFSSMSSLDLLSWWLAERQCDSGGLNGRPEKQADVCYSWWIVSTLCIIGKLNYISNDKLIEFILKCQDDGVEEEEEEEDTLHRDEEKGCEDGTIVEKEKKNGVMEVGGGIADRPGDMVDVFHTFFGIAGLSLLGYLHPLMNDDNEEMNILKGERVLVSDSDVTKNNDGSVSYRKIDPVYALPTDIVRRLGLGGQVLKPRNEDLDERLDMYEVIQS